MLWTTLRLGLVLQCGLLAGCAGVPSQAVIPPAPTIHTSPERQRRDTQARSASEETRYRTGLVPQQDVLQADVELGRQQERQLVLERMREVAVARINTLMNLPTAAPLPPAPHELKPAEGLLAVEELQARALAQQAALAEDRLAG